MPNFAGLITIDPERYIGPITAQVTLEEISVDELQITEHPVELGANITDHSFKRPAELIIRCGWSNSSLDALLGAVDGLLTAITGGDLFGSDYVSGVYNQLLALQNARVPFSVATGKRIYQNMLMRSLALTTDPATENALLVTMVCREVLIVETRATTLPPRDQQANPQDTAETTNRGTQQATSAAPSPGGTFNPAGG